MFEEISPKLLPIIGYFLAVGIVVYFFTYEHRRTERWIDEFFSGTESSGETCNAFRRQALKFLGEIKLGIRFIALLLLYIAYRLS